MYKIEGNTIMASRGDAFSIDFTIEDYVFTEDDVVKLSVFDRNSSFEDAYITIIGVVDLENNKVVFSLNEDDTAAIGDAISKPTTYWYQISLNGDQTVLGYDEDGPKPFIIYPAEVGDTNA